MKPSSSTQIHRIKQLGYYTPKEKTHYITETQFQRQNNNEANTFRLKRHSQFDEMKYMSSLNPFTRKSHIPYRYNRPTQCTYERKKRRYYDLPDPIVPPSLGNPEETSCKLPFNPSYDTRLASQKRYELPADRKLAKPNKFYFQQRGFSRSLEKPVKAKGTNSKLMWEVIAGNVPSSGISHSRTSCTQSELGSTNISHNLDQTL